MHYHGVRNASAHETQPWVRRCTEPSFACTVRHDCQVIRRITIVIPSPMSGSATGTPAATTAAEATSPRGSRRRRRQCMLTVGHECGAADMSSRCAFAPRAATKFAVKPMAPAIASAPRWVGGVRCTRRSMASTPATHTLMNVAAATARPAPRSAGRADQSTIASGTAVSASPKLWIRSARSTDTAARHEHNRLCDGRNAEDEKRDRDRPHSFT